MAPIGHVAALEPRTLNQGPGVRFTVYLQGCRLRCPDCVCAATDPCFCSRAVTVPTVIGQIRTFREFMTLSGGGVTVAGGEPLRQPGFVAQLFRQCRDLGLSTALNTQGIGNLFAARSLLRLTDLVVLDITGACHDDASDATMIDTGRFSRLLGDSPAALWLRYVVIPGINDDDDAVAQRLAFAQSLDDVERVEIRTVSDVREPQAGPLCPGGAPAPRQADATAVDRVRRRFRAAGLYAA
ncbi:MAG: 4Fe-4S cluster-binding domain-containing protein [Azospirillaceae bacterium]|nr:4Fe-4S cluster-binding domain-containing protein [Azospirillaceae bacterium]